MAYNNKHILFLISLWLHRQFSWSGQVQLEIYSLLSGASARRAGASPPVLNQSLADKPTPFSQWTREGDHHYASTFKACFVSCLLRSQLPKQTIWPKPSSRERQTPSLDGRGCKVSTKAHEAGAIRRVQFVCCNPVGSRNTRHSRCVHRGKPLARHPVVGWAQALLPPPGLRATGFKHQLPFLTPDSLLHSHKLVLLSGYPSNWMN